MDMSSLSPQSAQGRPMIKSGEYLDRFICFCMGGGSPPPPPPPPPAPPSTENAEAISRARDERTKALAAQGLRPTSLTARLRAPDYSRTGRGTVLGTSTA